MRNITLGLLATAAIGAVSIGSAAAMPFNNGPAALGESQVQDVRLVCDRRHQQCYNTRAYRAHPYYAQRYYDSPTYYGGSGYGPGYGYADPGYGGGYGYYGRPRVGIGIGPFGFGW